MQFIAERGIERSALPLATNGTQERLPIRNPYFPQSSELPLYKEELLFFPKLRRIPRFISLLLKKCKKTQSVNPRRHPRLPTLCFHLYYIYTITPVRITSS